MSEQLAAATNERDMAEAWRNLYCLSGSGLRRKKRWSHTLSSTVPTVQEWNTTVARPGFEGGQNATAVWQGHVSMIDTLWELGQEASDPVSAAMIESVHQSRPPPAAAHGPLGWQRDEASADVLRVLSQLRRPRSGHAVPLWSCS
jgi:hypothetical protein